MSISVGQVASALQPEGAPRSAQAPIQVQVAAERPTDMTMPNGLLVPAIDLKSKNQAKISSNRGVYSQNNDLKESGENFHPTAEPVMVPEERNDEPEGARLPTHGQNGSAVQAGDFWPNNSSSDV